MKTGINNHDLLSQCGVYGVSKTSVNDIMGKADRYQGIKDFALSKGRNFILKEMINKRFQICEKHKQI